MVKGWLFLIMDLNKFKSINDTHGHDVGDMVLKEFAARLVRSVRETDTIGRLGGDEFAVLIKPLIIKEDIHLFIRRFQQA